VRKITTKKILDKIKSHYTGFIIGKKGDDYFEFNIPEGYQYHKTVYKELDSTMNSHARVEQKPSVGQTGRGLIKVHWWYNAFGKIRYNIQAFAKKIPQDTVPEPEIGIYYSSIYSHYTGFIIGKKSDDYPTVQLPTGYSFKKVELIVLNSTMRSGARIVKKPMVGSTGKLTFKVHWWYNGFGKIRYKLRVTAEKSAQYQLRIANVSWTPNPATVGNDVDFSIDVKNIGTETIEKVKAEVITYVRHLNDLSDAWLEAYEEERTQTVYQTADDNLIEVNAGPNEEKTIAITFQIPATIEATENISFSPAGEYRVTMIIYHESGIQIGTHVINSFRIDEADD